MDFELTEALIDEILFAMEDQQEHFVLDTAEMSLVNTREAAETGETGRYSVLPEWNSADGFRLMEGFIVEFKNPVINPQLNHALKQGRGVFRGFKDVLSRYPEAAKRWQAFKKEAMRAEVLRWYQGLRQEALKLRLGSEPEETADLVLEDFVFRAPTPEDTPRAEGLYRRLRAEEAHEPVRRAMPERLNAALRLVAETSAGDFAGYIGSAMDNGLLDITLAVTPEYRGLGIGEELCARFLEILDSSNSSHSSNPEETACLTLSLPTRLDGFSRVLLRHGFEPFITRYYKTPHLEERDERENLKN